MAGNPSSSQVALDPLSIPKFAHQLPIPRTFAPTLVTDSSGRVIQHKYQISVAHTQVQMLPPGFPMTTVRAFGGDVKIPGSSLTEFIRTVPGPVFDNTRGIPTLLQWRNSILDGTFMPIDPTLHWANPKAINRPQPPFQPFPPGYQDAQFPVAHVVHTHGLVVAPFMDGTAEEWFTPFEHRGPAFRTMDYQIPNEQPSTQLFYHDHVMGATRQGVYAGSVGAAYFIRDPGSPLDGADSPLPQGQYEIPLVVFDRSFFTDGELNFPRVSTNRNNAYWQAGDGANVVLVNGKTWPNFDVERRQYRFRMLAAGNGRLWTFELRNGVNAGPQVPFTIIGSDGGYLPAPQQVTQVILGITERADILVDFSQFAPATQIIMINAGADPNTVGTVMRFTVLDTSPVAPPALDPSLFPARQALVTNAPTRIKTLHVPNDQGNVTVELDRLKFTTPVTELPLNGSTEEWKFVNTAGVSHQVHLHLLEFQVLERQTVNAAEYLRDWQILNGHRPMTRQIVLDPTPYLTGIPTPPLPYETGWKDTVRTPGNQVTRITTRWAPQELAANQVAPGQNRWPGFDPVFFPNDPHTGQGYVWHCHILGHEDNEMMRKQPLVDLWGSGVNYPLGKIIAFNDVNYRVRVAHSASSQTPDTQFDRWERVNNNDGSWQPQIIFAVGDRVLHQGQLFRAKQVHQSLAGQTPPGNPALWEPLPMTACGQLTQFCADKTASQTGANCLATGQAAVEATCRTSLAACLPVCDPVTPTPCAGLCSNPVAFTRPDGTTFQSGALGSGATCHETQSQLLSGSCGSWVAGRALFINGREICNGPTGGSWGYPLPPQRNDGYCIQTTAGGADASFSAF
jgi:FtsP/CotA-like multicopper oxidase with cupredoxin domain